MSIGRLSGFGVMCFALCCGGCASVQPVSARPEANAELSAADTESVLIVTATGHGAINPQDGYSPEQKKLMAVRASKADAYRNLAERLQGIKVASSSSSLAFASQGDAIQISTEAFLRGARVVSVTPLNNGIYETVVEIELNSRAMGADK